MIIKNKDLDKMLKEKGKDYTKTMYVNRKFDLTKKQRERMNNYEEKKKMDQ